MDPFSTHQASLVAAMLKTRGPILELGGGWYSTPLISAFANGQQRAACTVETSESFLQQLKRYASPRHELHRMAGFNFEASGKFAPRAETPRTYYIDIQTRFLNDLCGRQRERWSVVLVDHRPGFLRAPAVRYFMNLAEFVIVHDTQIPAYNYEPELAQYRYRCDVQVHVPATTIVSNFQPCDSFAPPGSA